MTSQNFHQHKHVWVFFSFIIPHLPLLPVLDVLEGRAGVCAFDGPADMRQKHDACDEAAVITSHMERTGIHSTASTNEPQHWMNDNEGQYFLSVTQEGHTAQLTLDDLISLALWLIESCSVNMWVPEDPEECVDSPGEGFMSTEPSCCVLADK